MWLKAPIVEEGQDGKRRYKKNEKGTPQGGVISPLLANIYLNVLDKTWKVKRVQEKYNARLIRYADDLVVLCQGKTKRILKGIERVMGYLKLELNKEKTKVIDAEEEKFEYLGFAIEMKKNKRTGKRTPLIKPSKEALNHIRREIKEQTGRNMHKVATERVISRINTVVRGWTNYFYYGNNSRDFNKLKEYLNMRIRTYMRRKHRVGEKGYRKYAYSYLYGTLGLYKIPTTAAWKHLRKPLEEDDWKAVFGKTERTV
jgi:group II intron reverse transcriptase/maturase